MIKIYIYLAFFLALSCKSSSLIMISEGTYKSKIADSRYVLELQNNGKFIVTEYHLEVMKTCKGSWEKDLRNTIILSCEKEEDIKKMFGTYLMDRTIIVSILSSTKLNYKGTILKAE